MTMQNNLGLPEPVAIIGFGLEGQSTLRWLMEFGVCNIVVLDRQAQQLPELPNTVNVEILTGENYWQGLAKCASAVRSAGVYPLGAELLQWQKAGGILTSQVELFFSLCKAKIIGVTGTLGKGTCVTMLEHILRKAGQEVLVGGNIGVAALDLLPRIGAQTLVILELSSFQLMTLKRSPHCSIVLRVTSEHLDWHRSLEEYRGAKANLVRHQDSEGVQIFCADAPGSSWIADQGKGKRLAYGRQPNCDCLLGSGELSLDGQVLKLADCQVRGEHQLENMAAALLAAKSLGIAVEQAMVALHTHEGLPYRLQDSGVVGKVRYFNDSYATRPEAALAAARAMQGSFSLILGGSEKHADFTEMAQGIASLRNLCGIALIGATAGRLQQALQDAGVCCAMAQMAGLEEALQWCTRMVKDGGAVLMSPACASFGLFPNYKVRGQKFDAWVKAEASRG